MSQTQLSTRIQAALGGCLTAVLVAVPGTASAVPPAPNIEFGMEVGQVHFSYTCDIEYIGQQVLEATLAGTVGAQFGPGQKFWFSDGSGTLTIPAAVVNAMISLGGSYLAGQITSLVLNGENTDPASINAADPPIVAPELPLVSGEPLVVPLPQSGQTLTVGPFTVTGAKGSVVRISAGPAGGTFDLRDADHATLLTPNATCQVPNPSITLAAVNVGFDPGQPDSKPSIGHRPSDDFGDVPLGFLAGGLTVNAPCVVDVLGPNPRWGFGTLIGTVPSIVTAGGSFQPSGGGYLRIPKNVVNEVLNLPQFQTATSANGKLTQFVINADNATPESINAADPPIDIPTQPITRDQDQVIAIPAGTATITMPAFTASGPAGSYMTLSIGSSGAGMINLSDAGGTQLGTININCSRPDPKGVLTQITIA